MLFALLIYLLRICQPHRVEDPVSSGVEGTSFPMRTAILVVALSSQFLLILQFFPCFFSIVSSVQVAGTLATSAVGAVSLWVRPVKLWSAGNIRELWSRGLGASRQGDRRRHQTNNGRGP